MIVIKIFYAIIMIWTWYLMLKYRQRVKSWTWNFYWAEKYLWRWWTHVVITLVACGLIFLWALYPFWWVEFLFNNK